MAVPIAMGDGCKVLAPFSVLVKAAKDLRGSKIDRHADIKWHNRAVYKGGIMPKSLKGLGMNPLLKRISINPEVAFGKPCIAGTRIWVSLILDLLANGTAEKEVLKQYPQLRSEDIRAAIAYGAAMSREHYVELTGK